MQQLFQNLRIKRIIKYDLIEKWNVEFAEKIYLQDKFKNYGQHEIHKNNKGKHYCRSSTRRHERHLWSILEKYWHYLRISLTKTCSNALTFSIESARPKRQMLVRTLASPFSPSVEIIPPGAENTKIGQFLIKILCKK